MDSLKMRKLVSTLIFISRELYVDREVMQATLNDAAKRSRVLADWESEYLNLRQNPPAPIATIVGEKFQLLIALRSFYRSFKDWVRVYVLARRFCNLHRTHSYRMICVSDKRLRMAPAVTGAKAEVRSLF
jgi:hypothetical protein